ncbi:MAG TPA: hypothetical protein DCQ92_15875 [Verrucomicrobia subdivision 3 bacterium]|nr:hypothetical protein [Limisphaerales bacterium]
MQRGSRQLHRNCQSARECRLDLRSQFRPFRQRKSSIFIGKKNDEKMMDKHRLGYYFFTISSDEKICENPHSLFS